MSEGYDWNKYVQDIAEEADKFMTELLKYRNLELVQTIEKLPRENVILQMENVSGARSLRKLIDVLYRLQRYDLFQEIMSEINLHDKEFLQKCLRKRPSCRTIIEMEQYIDSLLDEEFQKNDFKETQSSESTSVKPAAQKVEPAKPAIQRITPEKIVQKVEPMKLTAPKFAPEKIVQKTSGVNINFRSKNNRNTSGSVTGNDVKISFTGNKFRK